MTTFAAARRLPAIICRCKGVVFTAEEPTRRAVLRVVGKRVDISLAGKWGSQRTPVQKLCGPAAVALD
jgi:G3E family GTPase